jgi:acetolactate synthase-1/2/3 large subunit
MHRDRQQHDAAAPAIDVTPKLDGRIRGLFPFPFTAAQERVDLCIIVMNDGIYAAIGHIQDAKQDGRRFYGALHGPDLEGLARLAGIAYRRVDRADQLQEAVTQALGVDGPSLVEVDMRAIGPVPAYGVYRAAG